MKFFILLYLCLSINLSAELQRKVSFVKDAKFASIKGLAEGSSEALMSQKKATKKYPLEVKLNKSGIVFRLIPAGEFVMGSPKSEENRKEDEKQKNIFIKESFYMGKFEITQGQWEMVMGIHPKHEKDLDHSLPVANVTWHECNEFIAKLENLEGLGKGVFALPSDIQWEYACRAGTKDQFYTGKDKKALHEAAWFYENSGTSLLDDSKWHHSKVKKQDCKAHPVGLKKANAWGLHDMLGNVVEWCSNLHNDKEPRYVTKGGSWRIHSKSLRAAFRNKSSPASRYSALGFRIMMKNDGLLD